MVSYGKRLGSIESYERAEQLLVQHRGLILGIESDMRPFQPT